MMVKFSNRQCIQRVRVYSRASLAASDKNWPNAARDEPPPLRAMVAAFLCAATRVLSWLPSSDSSNTNLTLASTSSALTSPCCHPTISTPTMASSTMNSLFIFCSAYIGQQSIGTPAVIPSSTEFHPQCVTNAPVALWLSTSTCGAQCLTTRPRSLVASRNPSGRRASRSVSARGSNSLSVSPRSGARTTHRKRWPDLCRPTATSLSCSSEWVAAPMLPKQSNTTLRSGCPSSHARHSCFSFASAPAPATSGPTQYTGGVLRALPLLGGTSCGSRRAPTARASSDANVFTKMPSGSSAPLRIAFIIAVYISLSGSSIWRTRCDAGMGGTPEKLTGASPSSLKLGWPSARIQGSWRNTASAEALAAQKV
uniref:Uncharacterized protein n=1 Tax=Zea mays TaxID=4577 RepID=A0A804QG91_MAIZE